QSEAAQALALSVLGPVRNTLACASGSSSTVIDRVDLWIDAAADFAVHAVWSGALPGPFDAPRPHLCAGLAAVCARRALTSDGVRGKQSTLLVARAVAAAISEWPVVA